MLFTPTLPVQPPHVCQSQQTGPSSLDARDGYVFGASTSRRTFPLLQTDHVGNHDPSIVDDLPSDITVVYTPLGAGQMSVTRNLRRSEEDRATTEDSEKIPVVLVRVDSPPETMLIHACLKTWLYKSIAIFTFGRAERFPPNKNPKDSCVSDTCL